jgi:hypothetical protein
MTDVTNYCPHDDKTQIELCSIIDVMMQDGEITTIEQLLKEYGKQKLGYRAFNYLEKRLAYHQQRSEG